MAKKKDDERHYGSILDYVFWRGDISFAVDPWNEIDSLILATIAYSNFGENEISLGKTPGMTIREFCKSGMLNRLPQSGNKAFLEKRDQLLLAMADSVRFSDVRVIDQVNDVDESRNIQFSAATFDVPGVGTMIGYRGTDSSLVGWKEDFMLSYDTPVPAQLSAMAYLQRIADAVPGDLYLAGHSKGGNLTVYTAAHAPASIQDRILTICSFDGPGLDEETMHTDGYRRIRKRLCSLVPSESIIGLLLNYYPNYQVVEATESSIWQHMPFTWKILGKEFVLRDTITRNAQVLDHSLHEWMRTCPYDEREVVVNTIFCLLANNRDRESNPRKLSDDLAAAGLSEKSVRMMLSLFYRLMTIHLSNSFGEKIRKPLAMMAGELRLKSRAGTRPVISSEQIEIDNRGLGFDEIMEEVTRLAEFTGLNHKDSMHLQLIAEEMLCMVRSITGEWNAAIRVLCEGNQFQLFLTTRTLLDEKKRDLFETADALDMDDGSFQTRLRREFEKAMHTRDSEEFGERSYTVGMGISGEAAVKWARFEQSVLYRLADDIRISIHGGVVFLTVTKTFAKTNMKSAVIEVDDSGKGFEDALEEAGLMAECNHLGKEDTARLRLFAEEMLNMIRTITGGVSASFWIERDGSRYDLLLTTKTVLNRRKRDLLLASASSGKNEASKGFLNSLRAVFEQAMTNSSPYDRVLFDKTQDPTIDGWDGYEQSILLRLADEVKVAIRGDEVKLIVSKEFPQK